MAQEGTASEDRRGSFGRTFEKIKDAVRRRSLGGKRNSLSEEVPTATSEVDSSYVKPADTPENALPAIEADDKPRATENVSMAAATETEAEAAARDSPLVVDEDYTGEYDYSTGPLHSIRNRIASARAKAVFDKYGIKYEEGDKQLDDGSKRVEKAIRIRIHWECHQCKASFSGRRTCGKCGHKRCPDCARAPAKRVKEVLGGTKVMEEIEKKAEHADENKDSVVVPIVTGQEAAPAAVERAPIIVPEEISTEKDIPGTEVLTGPAAEEAIPDVEVQGTLEKDEIGEDGETEVTQYQYTMQTRPRAGVQLVLRPKSQYIRRSCHECKTNFTPSSKRKCLNCGHDRCERCPRETVKSPKWPQSSGEPVPPESEQRMVGTVERVYKKARQRIRWACHECQTVFIGRADCSKCGHARCEKCPRSPLAKVPPAAPDAAVLASVAEKLAKLKGPIDETIIIGPEPPAAAG